MNKKRLSTLEHTHQVKITLTSEQIKYIDKECKKRFNMINKSHIIRQLIIDSIEKEKTIKDLKKEDNKNYLSFEEYSLIHSVLSDSVKAITEKEKITEVLKKLYYISILDYKQLNIFENLLTYNIFLFNCSYFSFSTPILILCNIIKGKILV